jgi:hypothetical protein
MCCCISRWPGLSIAARQVTASSGASLTTLSPVSDDHEKIRCRNRSAKKSVPPASTAAPAMEWNPPASFSTCPPGATTAGPDDAGDGDAPSPTSKTAKFRSRTCRPRVTSSSALS